MATFSRPGVYIQEVPLPQAIGQVNVTSAAGAFVGALPKGPLTPTLVTNWSDFVKTFGNLNDSYPTTWAAYNFFSNGGRQLYVRRVVLTGTAPALAVAGTATFNDGSGTALYANVTGVVGSSPTATITAATATGGTATFTATNTFVQGQIINITGITGGSYNKSGVAVATATGSQFTVLDAALTGTYTSGGVATSGVATYTATNTYTAGQTATVSGITATVTGSPITATVSGNSITFTVTSTAGLSTSSFVTVSGVTGGTGVFNGTWPLSVLNSSTQFTLLTTGALSGTPTVTSAVLTYSSLYNLTGTIATASGSQFTVLVSPTVSADRTVTGIVATNNAVVNTASNSVFTLTALNPGSWSSTLSAQVVSSGVAGRFGLNIYSAVTQNSITSTVIVESYTDLSVVSTDRNYIVNVINTYSGVVSCALVAAISPNTATLAPTAFTGATDGTGTLARSDYAVWSNFDSIIQPLVLYSSDAPYASAILSGQLHGDAMIYAAGRADCFVVVDTPSGYSTLASAQAQVTSVSAVAAGSTTGNIAAAYWPWYSIPDGTKGPGTVRLQAPGAGVVGQYLNTDATRGPAKTPAGLNNRMALAVSTEHAFTNAELDTMNISVDPINPIRQVPGAGVVIMGGRTMDNTSTNRYINIRRSLIYIENALNVLTAFAVFENNDSLLWNKLDVTIGNFLRNYWTNGNLAGNSPDQAFFVKCDSTTTSPTDIINGRVNIQVGVALQYPAEFVVIQIGQITGNASA